MPIPLTVLNDYVRCIEKQKAEHWRELEPLLNGKVHVGERKFGRPTWTDTTQRQVARLKATIAEYEGIFGEHQISNLSIRAAAAKAWEQLTHPRCHYYQRPALTTQ